MNDNIKISKNFTVANWKELRPQLLYSSENWPIVLHQHLQERNEFGRHRFVQRSLGGPHSQNLHQTHPRRESFKFSELF